MWPTKAEDCLLLNTAALLYCKTGDHVSILISFDHTKLTSRMWPVWPAPTEDRLLLGAAQPHGSPQSSILLPRFPPSPASQQRFLIFSLKFLQLYFSLWCFVIFAPIAYYFMLDLSNFCSRSLLFTMRICEFLVFRQYLVILAWALQFLRL